jgi:hypothetical protein
MEGPAGPLPEAPDGEVGALISGKVLSKELGVMPGVQVLASPVERQAVTDARGAFALHIAERRRIQLSLSGLPAGCEAPASQEANLEFGLPVRVRFLVDCGGVAE